VARFPALAANTLQAVGGRLQETQTRIVEISTQQVEQRIAHALLRLAKQSGRKLDHGVEIDFPITRQDIGQMTGTTLHTVSRILSGWEQAGLIESGRQRIVLREPHKIFVLAEQTPGQD
jgi:CRP/FNR family transcriptional regulator, nitrogen oxide reductase regulator